jgi:hypothetical protein
MREIGDDEGNRLRRIVRRGTGPVVAWRRAQVVLWSAQGMSVAQIAGVPRRLVPSNVPELDLYIASVRPGLACTPAAAESMACLLDPPGLDEDIAEICRMSATPRSRCYRAGRGRCT